MENLHHFDPSVLEGDHVLGHRVGIWRLLCLHSVAQNKVHTLTCSVGVALKPSNFQVLEAFSDEEIKLLLARQFYRWIRAV